MGLKFKNNAATTLAALVASTDLSLTVNSTLGSVFPVLGGGDYFYCTLQSLTTPTTIEVVKVTAVAGNVFTIVRAQDGTTAQNFSAGDRAELRLVAAVLNDIPKLDEANTFQLAMTLLQSLTVAGMLTAQAGFTAQAGVVFGDGSKLNSTVQLSFRNRIQNGGFQVNQRNITSPITLAAGATGFDRWKAGPGGCTFSFAASGNTNVITITAGTLIQVVEDLNVEGGVFALSHQGTAQARFGINGAVPSGAFAAATTAVPVLSAAATAKQTISVEFGVGTVDRVQVEPGASATPFERRPQSIELFLCRRFVRQLINGADATTENLGAPGYSFGTGAQLSIPLDPPMKAVPSLVFSNLAHFLVENGAGSYTPTGLSIFAGNSTARMAVINATGAGLTSGTSVSLRSQSAASVLLLTADI